MVKLISYMFVFSGIFKIISPSFEEDDDPFPGDFLTPYKENGLQSKRSKRSQTRGCQPVLQGNSSYEKYTSTSNSFFTSTRDFVRTNNFHYEMNDFGQRKFIYGHISVAENPLRTFSVLEPDRPGGCKASIRSTVAVTSKQRNCLAAINAGFFKTLNGQCLGNVVSNKRLVQDSGGVQNANFGIRKDGTIVVGYLSEETVLDKKNPFVQLVSGVVWLLRNRNVYVDESKKAECRNTQETGSMDLFANVISARTAIGHDSRGRIVFVQVDGKTHRRGINLYDFAKLLKKFDVVNAINLDGGGSSTFVINSTTVNYPSDECGDYICSRKVSTIACIHKPDCIPRDCNKHGKCHLGECICDRQWMGAKCDKPLCKMTNCSSNGVCTEDGCICFSGWKGDDCRQACQSGFYGMNCSKPCLCQNRGSCSHNDGSCKCQPGWIGPFCEQACPHGRYGLGCSQLCNCSSQFCFCDKETGDCLNNTNQIDDHESQKFLTCLLSKKVDASHTSKDNAVLDVPKKNTHSSKDYRQLFVWFIGAMSLCGVSLLANMVLIFLQCNRATRQGRSRQRPRLEETAFLFSPDEEEL